MNWWEWLLLAIWFVGGTFALWLLLDRWERDDD